MFDTKIAIVIREDLPAWQKLNVTAFLMSGIVGANPGIIGEPYRDSADNQHLSLSIQPVIVLAADSPTLVEIRRRALERKVATAIYIEEMFATGHDAANRESSRNTVPMSQTSSEWRCARKRRLPTRSPRVRGCILEAKASHEIPALSRSARPAQVRARQAPLLQRG